MYLFFYIVAFSKINTAVMNIWKGMIFLETRYNNMKFLNMGVFKLKY